MYGPDSGKGSWAGLNFMYEKVRIGEEEGRQQRVETLLQVGCGRGGGAGAGRGGGRCGAGGREAAVLEWGE